MPSKKKSKIFYATINNSNKKWTVSEMKKKEDLNNWPIILEMLSKDLRIIFNWDKEY